ncbi:MAG: regulator SirB [Thiothrix sp.]|nr:MAG: regulator SirB [Thiothrix sp.]
MLWLLKLHYLTVTLSLLGFVLRGVWMMRDSPLLQARLVKVLPHINDALLIFSAMGVAYLAELYPWEQSWMVAKLLALLVYILIGTVALKRGSTMVIRIAAWVMALLVFAYIVSVAMTHSPIPFLWNAIP